MYSLQISFEGNAQCIHCTADSIIETLVWFMVYKFYSRMKRTKFTKFVIYINKIKIIFKLTAERLLQNRTEGFN